MRNWLQGHSFSYKKATLIPGEANKEQQENGLLEGKPFCFIEGVHPVHIPYKFLLMRELYSHIERFFFKPFFHKI